MHGVNPLAWASDVIDELQADWPRERLGEPMRGARARAPLVALAASGRGRRRHEAGNPSKFPREANAHGGASIARREPNAARSMGGRVVDMHPFFEREMDAQVKKDP
ncbi:transposase domain-containing protein [Sorangium cellulosum]|uniref:transposase domain-containing protein n=1 Tax=Sorangium cellulosum TaxID=56 RepID=UPI001A92811D|nr:transposase domain-containing protein [Sorangium cellulosum]